MPVANIENADSQPYWEGARQGRLLLQRCSPCGHVQFPPRRQCTTCWSEDLAWIESSGRGTVESMTIVRRAPTRALAANVPYAVAMVLLAEGPRMVSNLVGPNALQAAIGDAVTATFVADADGRVLPQFERLTG